MAGNLWKLFVMRGMQIKAECEHVHARLAMYVDEDWKDKVPKKSEEEMDMLDLAFDVQENSRLSCQITITPDLDGKVTLAPD